MTVRVVTDSSSNLPAWVAEELHIEVVELHAMGDTTAGLSALELAATYARQLERGGDDGLVALHIGKELSSTWSNAVAAAAVFDNVRVIDTDTVGMDLGAAAMAAAKSAQMGADVEECYAVAVDILRRSDTWFYVHKLDALRKSGRLTTGAYVAATLAARPILHVGENGLDVAAKGRTPSKALAKMVELVEEHARGERVFVAIQQYEARETARRLEQHLRSVLAEGSNVLVVDISPAIAIHVGPGAVGATLVNTCDLPELPK
ncbi:MULTISPECIES: DegV family protein [Corynebacterium]|uniref:DegV family protein n=1 Tax=Corynebacterium TaxID=1716 RepID=UPI0008A50C84|nr:MULTISPECIES: DegV family protein [Corynebacterium]MCT1562983.1 DegV family EDD domain-containing protein [Corynebacterium glucuronolyticum]OFO42511.1 fatty acid-binding protein DegV [Corynebacterium sp. HMSC073D01]